MPANPGPRAPRSVQELGAAELFVLQCFRLWFDARANGHSRIGNWDEGFDRAGLPHTAKCAFHHLMMLIVHAHVRPIDVMNPAASDLGLAEAIFIDWFRAAQAGCYGGLIERLSALLAPAAARCAVLPCASIAGALDACGIRLSGRVLMGETQAPAKAPHLRVVH